MITTTTGNDFLKRAMQGRSKIAKKGLPFVRDGAVSAYLKVACMNPHQQRVLTHSKSRVVLAVLLEAARANRRFTVYVTESRPSGSGFDSSLCWLTFHLLTVLQASRSRGPCERGDPSVHHPRGSICINADKTQSHTHRTRPLARSWRPLISSLLAPRPWSRVAALSTQFERS